MKGHLASDTSFFSLYQQFGLATNSISTPYGTLDSVQPWLDHPPLMGFLMIPILALKLEPRLLPIILWYLTALALYLLFERNPKLAYSTVFAFIVFGQYSMLPSMVFLDAGVSFFLVLTVVLTSYYVRTRITYFLYLSGITAGLSALSKEVGVASIFYLALFWLYDKYKRKEKNGSSYTKALILAVVAFSTWIIFALIEQPTLFVDLVSANLGRSISSNLSYLDVVRTIFSSFSFNVNFIADTGIDYALILSWLGVAYLLAKRSVPAEIKIGLISYLVFFFLLRFTAVFNTIPFFPFYALALGLVINDFYDYVIAKSISRFRKEGIKVSL